MVGLVLRDELQTARYVTVVLPTLCWVRTSDRCLNETPRVQAQSGRSAAACRRLQGGWEVRAAVCHSSSTCRKSNTLAFSGRIHLGTRNHWCLPGEYILETAIHWRFPGKCILETAARWRFPGEYIEEKTTRWRLTLAFSG